MILGFDQLVHATNVNDYFRRWMKGEGGIQGIREMKK